MWLGLYLIAFGIIAVSILGTIFFQDTPFKKTYLFFALAVWVSIVIPFIITIVFGISFIINN